MGELSPYSSYVDSALIRLQLHTEEARKRYRADAYARICATAGLDVNSATSSLLDEDHRSSESAMRLRKVIRVHQQKQARLECEDPVTGASRRRLLLDQMDFCSWLVLVVSFGVCLSLAMYIVFSLQTHDWSGSATPAAYILGIFSILPGIVGLKHKKNCKCAIWKWGDKND